MSASSRLRSDFWAAAYLRRCATEGVAAVLQRRGAAEAGAIFILIDRLDGTAMLLGPAPQSEASALGERRFERMHKAEIVSMADAETRLRREIDFDPDLWVIAVEDRAGRTFLDD